MQMKETIKGTDHVDRKLFIRKLRTVLLRTAIAGLFLGTIGTALNANAEEITIGASLPMSGPLAGFGGYLAWGYKHAVEEVNQAGGIDVDGKKVQVKLIIRDDKTDPSVTASNTETLITRDHVVAMLGACTPAFVNAGALVAERHKVPLVAGCDPYETFTMIRKWNYAWDIFFKISTLAEAPFRTVIDLGIETNKKVAIFHDNGPDGQAEGDMAWPKAAKENGFEVVQISSFPTDNTQFTSVINEAKAKNAEILLVDASTPQAVTLRKQILSAGYAPKVIFIDKGAEPLQFAEALGKLSDGIIIGGYWDPSFSYPGAADLAKTYEKETHQTNSQHIADGYAVAAVLLDAIKAAGSTDPEKINDAIAKTDKTYVVGPVKFDADHYSDLPIIELQWQGGKTTVVWPKAMATGKLMPLPQ
jgi:branched-chain amino acid transport system substrate-binding protein